jgi:two-component system, NarL family, sensor histidine kinase FusK
VKRLVGNEAPVLYLLRIAALGAVYYGAAKLGLTLAFANRSVTAVWPPAGIALAGLLLWGYRYWPGVALGALFANGWTGVPIETVLGITAGNTLEALAGTYLLRRVARFRTSLRRVRDVLALAVLGAVVSTLVAATIGVASLRLGDAVSSDALGSTFRVWWLGDMGGDLLVAPFVLLVVGHRREARWDRWLEGLLLLAALAGVSALALSRSEPLAYVVFPFLIWAALRLGPQGAATANLIVAVIAVAYTANGHGGFVEGTRDDSLLLSQTFMGVAALTSLLLAAIAAERQRAVAESLAIRRREALEINDNIVQGLTVAQYAAQSGRHDLAGDALETTLADARKMIGELVADLPPDTLSRPGALRRRSPADPSRTEPPSSLRAEGG